MKALNKKLALLLLSGAAHIAAAPATAQDSAPGLTFEGYVELEYLFDGDGDDEVFGLADLTLNVGPGVFGGVPQLGFDAALRGFGDESDSEFAAYGAVALYTQFGKFSAGAPRPVVADMIDLPTLGGVRALNQELGVLTGSGIDTATLFTDVDTPLGLRYEHQIDALSFGASYHHFDEPGGELDAISLAMRYEFESFELFASYERFESGPDTGDAYIVGAEVQQGQWGGGVALFASDFFFDADGGQVWVDYTPVENLEVTATYIGVENNDFWGLSAEYAFEQGAYIQVGAADFGGNEIYDISFGWKF